MSSYQFLLYNHSGVLQRVYGTDIIHQLRYQRNLNNIGVVQFTLESADADPWLLQKDAIFEVARTASDGTVYIDETYLLCSWTETVEGSREVTIVGGVSLEHLLWRRIVIPDDDPLVANGFSTKSGAADTVMCSIVEDQCVSPALDSTRQIAGLTIAASGGLGSTVAFREEISSKRVIEALVDLTVQGNTDFRVIRTSGANFEFRAEVRGVDRTYTTHYPLNEPSLVFSPYNHTMRNPSLELNRREEGNVVYILGQGQPGQRTKYRQNGSGLYDSPWGRQEFAADSSNATSLTELETAAAAELKDKLARRVFSFEMEPRDNLHYNEDWSLGDKVSAYYKGIQGDYRITSVEIEMVTEGETMAVTLEEIL